MFDHIKGLSVLGIDDPQKQESVRDEGVDRNVLDERVFQLLIGNRNLFTPHTAESKYTTSGVRRGQLPGRVHHKTIKILAGEVLLSLNQGLVVDS